MLGVSGTPVLDAVGKSRDLRDHLGNKIKVLFHCDWDHYCMFPLLDGL